MLAILREIEVAETADRDTKHALQSLLGTNHHLNGLIERNIAQLESKAGKMSIESHSAELAYINKGLYLSYEIYIKFRGILVKPRA